MSRQPVSMTLNRGVLWFEDGTEVSNVSVELLKAAPELLSACEQALMLLGTDKEGENGCGSPEEVAHDLREAIKKARGE